MTPEQLSEMGLALGRQLVQSIGDPAEATAVLLQATAFVVGRYAIGHEDQQAAGFVDATLSTLRESMLFEIGCAQNDGVDH
jgi:hypothetical protein